MHILDPPKAFETVLVYTYFPYGPDYCELVKPVEQNIFINKTFVKNAPIFPDKFQNFYKCPLTLATYDIQPHMILNPIGNGSFITDGLDGITFRVISQRLKFTAIDKLASINVFKEIKIKNNDENNIKSELWPSLDMVNAFSPTDSQFCCSFLI